MRLIFPQDARTAATAAAGGGIFLLAGSASTTVHAVRDRLRPFTHQLSLSSTPGIISAELQRSWNHISEFRRMKMKNYAVERKGPGHAGGDRL